MFYQSTLPIFTKINLLLQRDSPCIHILRDVMESLLTKLLGRFVTVAAMDEVDSVTDVSFTDTSKQLVDDELMIGFITKQTLQKLKDEVEPREIGKFYAGVREFFVGAAAYIAHKFLWDDPVLIHSCFVDFEKRKNVSFQSVEYFITRFPEHCPPADRTDELYDEYRVYQCLPAIPHDILCKFKSSATDTEEEEAEEEEDPKIRADALWHELEKQRDLNGKKKFGLLAPIAKLVLTLPHSNADEERVFSLVRKNKTVFRPNLSLDTTLPSILQCKVNGFSHMNCFNFEPSCDLLQQAKQATWQYNKEHTSKP